MDMVVSPRLKSKSSDYSLGSEAKSAACNCRKDQGKLVFLFFHIPRSDFSKGNNSGVNTSRRKGRERQLPSRFLLRLQARGPEEVLGSSQPEHQQKSPWLFGSHQPDLQWKSRQWKMWFQDYGCWKQVRNIELWWNKMKMLQAHHWGEKYTGMGRVESGTAQGVEEYEKVPERLASKNFGPTVSRRCSETGRWIPCNFQLRQRLCWLQPPPHNLQGAWGHQRGAP